MRPSTKRKDASQAMRPARRRRLASMLRGLLIALFGLAGAGLTLSASAAHATDRIYWSNYDNDTISYANLNGSGGGQINTTGATVDGPMGLAIDPAAGRVYWANWGNPGGTGVTISYANLDGSGGGGNLPTGNATVLGPHGLAIDPAAGKIYWPNYNGNRISFANLNGSGGGDLMTGAATLAGPRGVAVDPASGRIYWANYDGNRLSYANLNGSGGGDLATGNATVHQPEGVAFDPPTGRIFFGNYSAADTISYANLDGSGGADLMTGAAIKNFPHGVAIDPAARKVYWANYAADVISYANLDGSGGGNLPTPGATLVGPELPALLEAPAGSRAPVLRGKFRPGSNLRCGQAAWADPISSLDYRTPQGFSYNWRRNGKPVAGATSSSLKVRSVADYSCQVTAQNLAGTASQASGSYGVFKIGKAKLNRKGTARLPVTVPRRGTLSLSGKGVVKQRPARRARASSTLDRKVRKGTAKLLIKAKGKAKRRLNRKGRAKVRVKVTYRPRGGLRSGQNSTVKLLKK
jgi:DNA-binding beta-propeller fold protein YncE